MAFTDLRSAATARGIKFGGAVQRYSELSDSPYAAIINGETTAIKVGGDFFTLYGGDASDSMKMNGFLTGGTWNGDGSVFTPTFSWGPDAFAQYARAHSLALHGHTLIWYFATGTVPDGANTAAKVQSLAKAHIQGVIQHYDSSYSDVMYAWDVVNEPQGYQSTVGGNGGIWAGMYPGDPNPARWVEQCFIWAAEVRRPGLKLFVNDYGIEFAGAAQDRMYAWLSDALSRGIPIDGIGFQCHFSLSDGLRLAEWRSTLERFATLGIDIQIAELDVGLPDNTNPGYPPRPIYTPQQLADQATAYAGIVQAAVECPRVTGIYLWNLAVKYSYGEYTDPEMGWYMGGGNEGLWDAALQKNGNYAPVLAALDGGIGTVTYPTSTTWEVTVTDLAPGTNTFTVSDGTDSTQVQILLPAIASRASGAWPQSPWVVRRAAGANLRATLRMRAVGTSGEGASTPVTTTIHLDGTSRSSLRSTKTEPRARATVRRSSSSQPAATARTRRSTHAAPQVQTIATARRSAGVTLWQTLHIHAVGHDAVEGYSDPAQVTVYIHGTKGTDRRPATATPAGTLTARRSSTLTGNATLARRRSSRTEPRSVGQEGTARRSSHTSGTFFEGSRRRSAKASANIEGRERRSSRSQPAKVLSLRRSATVDPLPDPGEIGAERRASATDPVHVADRRASIANPLDVAGVRSATAQGQATGSEMRAGQVQPNARDTDRRSSRVEPQARATRRRSSRTHPANPAGVTGVERRSATVEIEAVAPEYDLTLEIGYALELKLGATLTEDITPPTLAIRR